MSYTRFLRPLGFMLVMPIITTTCFAMQDSREASPLTETIIPVDALQLVIMDTDFETRIQGWSLTCTVLHKFIFSGITQIPDKYINLIDNLCIYKFTNLTYLNISENKLINDLKKDCFPHLKILDLSNNSMITNETLKNYPNIEELNLEGNRRIDNVGLSNCLNLRKLNLSKMGWPNGHNICIDTNTLGQLTELRYLCMKGTSILSPLNITPLVNLIHLDLSGYYPHDISYQTWLSNNHLSYLTSLNTLNIKKCNGMQITDQLKTILPKLEILR